MSKLKDKVSAGEVYFIAEMSANHGNNLETALSIVSKFRHIQLTQ